jgi:hypothetical protein
MGYGARALQALNAYYSGEYLNLDESAKPEVSYPDAAAIDDVRRKSLTLPHTEAYHFSVYYPSY